MRAASIAATMVCENSFPLQAVKPAAGDAVHVRQCSAVEGNCIFPLASEQRFRDVQDANL